MFIPRMPMGRNERSRRGSVAVEMALVAPLLIFIGLGCVDFGRFIHTHVMVINAAAEAATFGCLNPPSNFEGGYEAWLTAVQQAAINEAPGLDPLIATGDVMAPEEVFTDGVVQVRVDYPFETLIDWPGIPHQVTLTCQTVMPQTK